MNKLLFTLKALLQDNSLKLAEQVQSLWGAYGQIIRVVSQEKN